MLLKNAGGVCLWVGDGLMGYGGGVDFTGICLESHGSKTLVLVCFEMDWSQTNMI